MRMDSQGHEQVDALYRQGRHIILAFWHAQRLMVPTGYRGTGANVLISQHQDGAEIVRAHHLSIRASGGPWIEHQGWGACLAGADLSLGAIRC